ncbi:PREDICTED: uncharacterized protein LOC104801218 [Tarenaya hassleriana]|uniref:uncharacterized protein LOC104801218 n=1 Tax=Tarenaya hassleriana TaxID=28532 RepID=UPI00053C0C8C|nr:PREDICTED: uncharacterized protein LOC104801218 [Tarenaya hassleriana]
MDDSRCCSCRAKAESRRKKKEINEMRHEAAKEAHNVPGDKEGEKPVNKPKQNPKTESEDVQSQSTGSKSSSDSDGETNRSTEHKNKGILTWRHPSLKKVNQKQKQKEKPSFELPSMLDCTKPPPFYVPTTMYNGSYYPPYPTMAAAPLQYFWHARPHRQTNPMVRYTSYADNYLHGFF